MGKTVAVIALGATLVLSACGNTDAERAATGALFGVGVAEVTGSDKATGAALGAVAGAYCDDLTPEYCR